MDTFSLVSSTGPVPKWQHVSRVTIVHAPRCKKHRLLWITTQDVVRSHQEGGAFTFQRKSLDPYEPQCCRPYYRDGDIQTNVVLTTCDRHPRHPFYFFNS